jgi:hypothetical protein
MLGSYTNFGMGLNHYEWLQSDLSQIDKGRTLWLISLFHVPFYNTNLAHQGEGDGIKKAMEQLLHDEKVNIVFFWLCSCL